MANTSSWKFVTPGFVTSKFKRFKTSTQVKNFAVSHDVFCGWWKNESGKGRFFLVEFNSFRKACKTFSASHKSTTCRTNKKFQWKSGAKHTFKNTHRTSITSWAKKNFTSRRAA